MALLFYWVRSAWRRHWEHYRYYLVYSRQTEYYSSRMPRAERTVAKGSPHHVTQRAITGRASLRWMRTLSSIRTVVLPLYHRRSL
jgi:hypothetical protein